MRRRRDLPIDYRCTTAEELADAGERFDIVLAMEVVEHVADVRAVRRNAAPTMVKPGGLMIVATLNRTLKSFALAIVGAEYVLRWLPRGTPPLGQVRHARTNSRSRWSRAGCSVIDETGVIYNLLADRWQLSTDMDVNYMLAAEKPCIAPTQCFGTSNDRRRLALGPCFTLLAAAGQTVRNAMQRELTATLGTVGATHVRFLFGFPFALVFLAGVLIGDRPAAAAAAGWRSGRGCCSAPARRFVATALMLAAMNDRSFVVTIAYIKTEAMQAAVFGLLFLGDPVTLPMVDRHPDRDRRRGADVAQGRRAGAGRLAADAARACRRRHVRAVGDRLSRRHPVARAAELRAGGDLHAGRSASCCRRRC